MKRTHSTTPSVTPDQSDKKKARISSPTPSPPSRATSAASASSHPLAKSSSAPRKHAYAFEKKIRQEPGLKVIVTQAIERLCKELQIGDSVGRIKEVLNSHVEKVWNHQPVSSPPQEPVAQSFKRNLNTEGWQQSSKLSGRATSVASSIEAQGSGTQNLGESIRGHMNVPIETDPRVEAKKQEAKSEKSEAAAAASAETKTAIDDTILSMYTRQEFYMQLALAAALRSGDPKTQVGCVIVDKAGAVIGVGYNGMPYGVKGESNWDPEKKALRVVHAETNALMHVANNAKLEDSSVYVTLFPCARCASALIQAKVRQIVYYSYRKDLPLCDKKPEECETAKCSCKEEDTYDVSEEMLREAGVTVYPFFRNKSEGEYKLDDNMRLNMLVFTFKQMVMLLHTLKKRENEPGFVHNPPKPWPMINYNPPPENDISTVGGGGDSMQDDTDYLTVASSRPEAMNEYWP